ncbi:MAG: branched-chain amino acid ABC transporter permease [Candidatus Tectomicrobia bacterium]|uniref:Branched-chain amino acid ABC transporter permease n=1 Tax=Tectimicrobiota bacterium TaxID=2528274 RepID=A0A932GQD0_UNCTE|nr:branched-chain amino acid ABC transporter permease [Candidatus Tectomicrobia bacterium]
MTLLGSQILQYVLSGIVVGGIYALIAIGFVVIFNVTGIINFAQGEFVMFGGMLAVSLNQAGFPLGGALLAATLLTALLGALVERAAIKPAKTASISTQIIITIGASIALRGIALMIWGTDPYPLPSFSDGPPLVVAEAAVVQQGLWVIGVTLLLLVGLHAFFHRTLLGKALRACAYNSVGALLNGISVSRMSLLSFSLSAGLSAVAGIVISPITYATYDMGSMLGLKGFVAAMVGGLTSIQGAVVGGLLVGILESLGAGVVSSGYKDAVAFLVLLALFFLKPEGILGGKAKA